MHISIERLWQSEWVWASEDVFNREKGHFEPVFGNARAVIGKSEKGFHAGVEEIQREEQLPLRWGSALPVREQAEFEARTRLNDWLRDKGKAPTRYKGPTHEPWSKEESDGWARERNNIVEMAFIDVSQKPALFSPGEVSITPEAFQVLKEHGLKPDDVVNRHIRGDWSGAPVEWIVKNEASVAGVKDYAILSVFHPNPLGPRICVGTHGNRSATSIKVWPHVPKHGPLMSVEAAERLVGKPLVKQGPAKVRTPRVVR